MAGAGGLAVVLLGGAIAFFLILGTIVGAGYALLGKHARRGYRIGIASTIAAVLAIVLSLPFWIVVLTGRDTHGEPWKFSEGGPVGPLVVLEAVVLLASIGGTIRQHRRRTS
jgi:hypothetical protein